MQQLRAMVRTAAWVVFLGAVLVMPLAGQTPDPNQSRMTREQLQALLGSHEQSAGSSAYSNVMRARARTEVDLIKQRLEEGDFQVGDRIILAVEGEDSISNTYVVTDQRTILLPTLGHVPLDGVLRSELEDYLTTYISRYIRNPRVSAHSQIRLTVTGGVENPGFFVVPPEALVTDVLMQAGGVTSDAILTEIEIKRRDRQVISPEALTIAIQQGRTLDQLNMRAGDVIEVSQASSKRNFFSLFTVVTSTALTLALIVTQLR
jgi:protein involved in polysaccharide export with SLBB domain